MPEMVTFMCSRTIFPHPREKMPVRTAAAPALWCRQPKLLSPKVQKVSESQIKKRQKNRQACEDVCFPVGIRDFRLSVPLAINRSHGNVLSFVFYHEAQSRRSFQVVDGAKRSLLSADCALPGGDGVFFHLFTAVTV